jgi:hypothetical protein
MTDVVIDTQVLNTLEQLQDSGDTLLVTSSGSLNNLDSDGIISEADDQQISIYGLVFGDQGVTVTGNNVSVIVNGDVGGTLVGVFLSTTDGDSLVNSGTISGPTGIVALAGNSTKNIENSGTIEGSTGAAITSSLEPAPGDSGVGISVVNSGSGLLTNAAANTLGNTGGVLFFDDTAGTTSTIDNQGAITGAGYVIQSLSDILDIFNSGTIHGGLFLSDGGAIRNSGNIDAGLIAARGFNGDGESLTNAQNGTITASIFFTAADDFVDNAGAIDGAVSLAAGSDTFTNAGAIDGAVKFTGAGANNALTNSGSITGNVTLAGAGSEFKNHNQIYGDVTLGRSETLINTGVIHGDVTLGALDSVNDSRGKITDAITASSNDTFVYNGLFGEETINKFVAGSGATHDTIQFAANDFGTFAAVQGAMHQVGADTVITLDAADSITLVGVAKSSLVASDFKFV